MWARKRFYRVATGMSKLCSSNMGAARKMSTLTESACKQVNQALKLAW
jgi:hypothetical protein